MEGSLLYPLGIKDNVKFNISMDKLINLAKVAGVIHETHDNPFGVPGD